jgi:hypothetical protein
MALPVTHSFYVPTKLVALQNRTLTRPLARALSVAPPSFQKKPSIGSQDDEPMRLFSEVPGFKLNSAVPSASFGSSPLSSCELSQGLNGPQSLTRLSASTIVTLIPVGKQSTRLSDSDKKQTFALAAMELQKLNCVEAAGFSLTILDFTNDGDSTVPSSGEGSLSYRRDFTNS